MMTKLDYSKPVRIKYPQPGKEDLVYKVTGYNEETNRGYIQIQNLPKGEKAILPGEPVSLDDFENIPTKEKNKFKAAILSVSLALSANIAVTVLWLVFTVWIWTIGSKDIIGILILCLYYMVIAVCCFFIVRQNPGSVWYVPVISNAITIYFSMAKINFRNDLIFLIPVGGGLILSILASMSGARRGKKDAVFNHSETE